MSRRCSPLFALLFLAGCHGSSGERSAPAEPEATIEATADLEALHWDEAPPRVATLPAIGSPQPSRPGKGTRDVVAPEPTPEAGPPRGGYLSSTYVGGAGSRDRLAALVDGGVLIDGEEIELEALTAQYHQPVAVPAGQALALFAAPEHSRVQTDGGTTHLQIGIPATSRELAARPALQRVLVVDVSSSMKKEEKIMHARRAADALIDRMAPEDQLAIVAYATEARVALPLGPVGAGAAAHAAVRSLHPNGSTNVDAGLQAAYELLGDPSTQDAVRRVVLVSDGRPTAGITDPATIRRNVWDAFQRGVQTTTLGVGLDFGADLMMDLARDGEGNYHFLADGGAIADVLDSELEELTHAVAQAVRLTIHLDDGVALEHVLGAEVLDEQASRQVRAEERTLDARMAEELGITSDRQEEKDDGLKLLLPTIHAGRHHVVMLRVRVPAGTRAQALARVELEYKDPAQRTNVSDELTVSVERASTRMEMVESLDPAVKKNLLGFQTGEALLEAARAVDRGRPMQGAERVDEQMALVALASQRWRDPDLEADAVLLGRYRDLLQATAEGSTSREVRAYLAQSLSYSGYQLTR